MRKYILVNRFFILLNGSLLICTVLFSLVFFLHLKNFLSFYKKEKKKKDTPACGKNLKCNGNLDRWSKKPIFVVFGNSTPNNQKSTPCRIPTTYHVRLNSAKCLLQWILMYRHPWCVCTKLHVFNWRTITFWTNIGWTKWLSLRRLILNSSKQETLWYFSVLWRLSISSP